MKKLTFTILILLSVSIVFAQEKNEKMLLNFLTSHEENSEYVYGKIKEIHYRSFHITNENGKIVKGKPFTLAESENVPLRQPWSYFYNESGQLVKKSLRDDKGIIYIGVVHHVNDRIEKVYWLKVDTLLGSDNYTYFKKGNIEQQWKSNQNDEYFGKTIYEMDKNGFLVKSSGQDKDGKVGVVMEYTRNPGGTTKTYKVFSENGEVKHYYDNYKYNDHGLFESCQFKLLNGKEPEYPGMNSEYEYDEHGNWSKNIARGWMMVERKIVYYE